MAKCKESVMVYGPSGAGKTSQGGELALYVLEKEAKKTRLASFSGGGWAVIQHFINRGIIDAAYLRDRLNPVETLDRVTKGWWPEDPQDPMSPLLPPEKQKDWADVGAILFDGLTESCEWTMNTMVMKEAKGEVRISTEGLAARFKDGDTFYGTPGRAHYMTIQNNSAAFVTQSKSLADRYIVWTGLELRAADDVTKLPVYSVDVIGKAKSATVPAWFDDTLHLVIVPRLDTKTKQMVDERRMYLTQHTLGDDTVPYLAKTRIPVGVDRPEFLAGKDFSLYTFLKMLEQCVDKADDILSKRLEEIGAEASVNLMSHKTN